jgi:hypothetical protein
MHCHRYYLGSGIWGLFVEGISGPVCTAGDGGRLDDMIARLERPGLVGESEGAQLAREAEHAPALQWRLKS